MRVLPRVCFGVWVCVSVAVAACGGSKAPADAPASSSPSATPSASAAASTSTTPAAAKAERPVAATSQEATSLIDDALTLRQKEIGHCVLDARTRRNNLHAEVVLEIGIDQEGRLIGVKNAKGAAADPALQQCVLTALQDAPFPRSKAGVITVKKNFTDQVFYP
ncbi:MAG: hypothetical protein JWM74_507 [Myxococcaceae bacterium]|nr:hypothetical protein [Myxococcaceae bacterium]